MRYLSMHHEHARATGQVMTGRAAGTAFRHLLGAWRSRSRERRMLTQLDDRMLRDIGISRSQAMHESGKSFWQA